MTPDAALRTERAQLMRASSIEMTPRHIRESAGNIPWLAAGARVFVTWLPGSTFEATLDACITLRQHGFDPVAHIAARSIRDARHFSDICQQLREEADASRILLIAGGQAQALGAFSDTLQLLRTEIAVRAGLRHVYVAGHPEGHPDVPPARLGDALREKQDIAHDQGLYMEIITQFGFDAAAMLRWDNELRRDGIALPVNLGLHGLASARALVRYGQACGVGQSLRLMMTQRRRLYRLFLPCKPLDLVNAVAQCRISSPETLFCGLHFFPFGAVERTLAWRRGFFE